MLAILRALRRDQRESRDLLSRLTCMAKIHSLGFRVPPEINEALTRAAQADDRSVSSLIERILKQWLIENGFLKPKSEGEA